MRDSSEPVGINVITFNVKSLARKLTVRDDLKDPGVDGRIKLKWIVSSGYTIVFVSSVDGQ